MSPACKDYDGRKCLHQVFRPDFQMPSWMRPHNMGDCTTCGHCAKNAVCVGYEPEPSLVKIDIEKEST